MPDETTPARGGARRASRSVRLSRSERRALLREREAAGRVRRHRAEPPARRAEPAAPAVEPAAPALTPAAQVTRVAQVEPAHEAGTARRVSTSRRGGARAARPRRRRTDGLKGTVGMTVLGAVVPGSGYLWAGRRLVGGVVLGAWVAVFGFLAWHFGSDWHRALDVAFDPAMLRWVAVAMVAGLLIWAFVVVTTYRMVRPRRRPVLHTRLGYGLVVALLLVMGAPVVQATRYVVATADGIDQVFDDNLTATTPDGVTEDDPWAGEDRVNVLLLGGDGDDGRDGVRTDSMILMSVDTQTGQAVTFSLPRNMMYAQFPDDSPLHDVYPDGFGAGEPPTNADYMLNAVYRNVPSAHPGILGDSTNEGADAIKQAVEGSLGLPVDYYVLVNLDGFRDVVNAMGGVTVNINEPVAIGGATDSGTPPDGWLAPGPDQHLDGYHALWFSRGRYGSDDYERMERQRCMVDAIVDEADPTTLLTHYLDLVSTGQDIVFTDIPRQLGPAFVELALRVKNAKVKSVVFETNDQFTSANPDFDYMRELVQKAIDPPPKTGSGGGGSPADDPEDACAYNPTGVTVEDVE